MSINHCTTCGEYTTDPLWCDDCMNDWHPEPDYPPMLVIDRRVQWIEGEPHEDTYLPGIPDYDRFGRPSWET